MSKPILPKALEPTEWKSNMGTVFKLKRSKTSKIAAQLKKIKTKHDAIKWDNFTPQLACMKCRNEEQIEEKFRQALMLHASAVVPFAELVKSLTSITELEAGQCKNDRLIPKKTRLYIEKMNKSSIEFGKTLGQNFLKNTKSNFDRYKEQLQKKITIGAKKVVKYMNTIPGGVSGTQNKMKSEKDEKTRLGHYESFKNQYVRGVGTSLPFLAKVYPELKVAQKRWNQLSSDKTLPKSDKEATERFKEITKLRKELIVFLKKKKIM